MIKHKTIIKRKSISYLKRILDKEKNPRVFLLTGKNSFKKCGAQKFIKSINPKIFKYKLSISNKLIRLEQAVKVKNLIKKTKSNMIIAVGGGGVIDMAKLANILLFSNYNNSLFLEKYKSIKKKLLPLYVIPTTSGTGSEETSFATVFHKKQKYSVDHPNLIPKFSIVDPELIFSLPSYITAFSGFDALSQCIESYWSISSTAKSRALSKKGIKLIINNIINATVRNSKLAKERMALAANLSGKAINITKTTAPHALSYEITRKLDIPHGHAVALILGKFFLINSKIDTIRKPLSLRIKKYRQTNLFKYLGVRDAYEAKNKWYNLMSRCGLKTDFYSLGLKNNKNIESFVNNINLERLENHPVKLNREILKSVFIDN